MTATITEKDRSSWNNLLISVKDALQSEEIDKAQVIQILSTYKSKEEDWRQYAFYDKNVYTRNLVDTGNGLYNLMILAWNPAQASSIHNHADSSCFVKVLSGALREIRYETPREGEKLKIIGDYVRKRDEVCFIDGSIGVHEMKNDTGDKTLTLHLYVPPFGSCKTFDRETAASSVSEMTFNSMYGEVVQQDQMSSKETYSFSLGC